MILLIDIGNTEIKIGVGTKDTVKNVLHLETVSKPHTIKEYVRILNSLSNKHRWDNIKGSVICSVVPDITPMITKAVIKYFGIKPLQLTSETPTGHIFPKNLGADRIAQLIAVSKLYQGNVIIVSFGTATVITVVTSGSQYAGGTIMPGVGLSIHALAEKTAQLPLVKLKIPDTILSRDTKNNILAGVIVGHAGAVERIINEIERVHGRKSKVVITGGFAKFVKPFLRLNFIEKQYLTLEGLRFLYTMGNTNL